ncbi:MAG: D-tyrosyl-tRNA(Tyr) deacylase [Kiritimatiellae bacterium]|nr:D-tyrosyl-tRNA(Tyr) deacylase [Kiritimatiellia bacterium]
MKALVQRVTEASVTIDGEVVAEIGRGYLVLFGVTHGDTEAMADKLASRVVKLRIFEDENGKTNKSIEDVAGSVIVVSQFTLYADTDHGNRPGFSNAARPDLAIPLYERFVADLRAALGSERVGTGRFGADMKVRLLNDGPFTVELSESPCM